MPRYPYGSQYTPPAPVLPVRVSRPDTVSAIVLPALVDTGADVSVVPQGLPTRMGLPVVGRIAVAGIDGFPHRLPIYAAVATLNGYSRVIRVVSIGATSLIGRDLLNTIIAHLHGPEAALELDLPPGPHGR